MRSFEKLRSASAPPNAYTCKHHDEGQDKLANRSDPVHLRLCEGDAPVLRLFGPDGNQILIGGKPIHGVQGEIAISVESQKSIGGPSGAADDDKTSLRVFFASIVGSRCR